MSIDARAILHRRYRILSHLVFWLAYLIFFTLQSGYLSGDYLSTFYSYCFYVIPIMIATYFNIYFLLPRFLYVKKYYLFFIIFIISSAVWSIMQRVVVFYVTAPLFYSPELFQRVTAPGFFYPNSMVSYLISIYTVVAIAASIKLLKNYYDNEHKSQILAKEKLEAELKYLKAQINPHFLFNSLNNLYGLSLKKSDKTPGLILKLSSLLNYMLYECDSKLISLSKEIEMLNDFIGLEKIRYGERLNIKFEITGDTTGVFIAPMILFPFVENSIKHGAGKELDESWINIKLEIDSGEINFEVENNKSLLKNNTAQNESEGIGLKNVIRQLDLLYSGKHNLSIEENESSFSVKLKLTL